jgi:hypothetical protein
MTVLTLVRNRIVIEVNVEEKTIESIEFECLLTLSR